jgi:PIN domain nuclease of toxin-antitoxin system
LILLDTNALIWYLNDSPRLGRAARNILIGNDRVCFSPISLVELKIKEIKGKNNPTADLGAAFLSLGFRELPFKSEDAMQLANFPSLAYHDPFDRMLLCQATTHNASLMTSDSILLSLGFDWIIDAQD